MYVIVFTHAYTQLAVNKIFRSLELADKYISTHKIQYGTAKILTEVWNEGQDAFQSN